MVRAWTQFDYLYRDADNYKAFGSVALSGKASAQRWGAALSKLMDDTCFVAEQLGVPSLCQQLFRWSGGAPTDADHCWHEYVDHRVVFGALPPEEMMVVASVDDFLGQLSTVESWNIWLSPNVRAY